MRRRSCLLALTLVAILGAGATLAAPERYNVDPVHTSVVFKVTHFGVSHFYGRFNEVGGSFVYDAEDPSKSSFEVTIKADSVDSGDEKRDQHLDSPDFFSVKEFPLITFKSKSVTKAEGGTLRATGDLTLHGVTKEITVDIEPVGAKADPRGKYRAGFDVVFTLNRLDYGMNYMPDALGKEVTVMVGIQGIRE